MIKHWYFVCRWQALSSYYHPGLSLLFQLPVTFLICAVPRLCFFCPPCPIFLLPYSQLFTETGSFCVHIFLDTCYQPKLLYIFFSFIPSTITLLGFQKYLVPPLPLRRVHTSQEDCSCISIHQYMTKCYGKGIKRKITY